jgi:hypothetical protein
MDTPPERCSGLEKKKNQDVRRTISKGREAVSFIQRDSGSATGEWIHVLD